MRFGRTHEEVRIEEQKYLRSIKDGWISFAWLPVRLDNGQYCWLERFKVKPNIFEWPTNGKLVWNPNQLYFYRTLEEE